MSEQALTTTIVAFFGFLTTVVSAVSAYYMAKVKGDTGRAVELSEKSAEVNEQIHRAVNSNYKEMTEKLDAQAKLLKEQNDVILKLSIDKEKAGSAPPAAGILQQPTLDPLKVEIVKIPAPEEAKKK